MNITEFLDARIAEDEAVGQEAAAEYARVNAKRAAHGWSLLPDGHSIYVDNDCDPFMTIDPSRVLAECAAKRAIVDDLFEYEQKIDYEWGCNHRAEQIRAGQCDGIKPEQINGLRILAAVYDQHPDYDQAWRP